MQLGDPVKIRKEEAAYRAWYVKRCYANGAHAQPIESNSTGTGIPDLYGMTAPGHMSYWMEFKIMSDIESTIPFEPGQLNWLYIHAQMGGHSFVNVLIGTMVYIFSCRCVDRMTGCIKDVGSIRGHILRVPKKHLTDDLPGIFERMERLMELDKELVCIP